MRDHDHHGSGQVGAEHVDAGQTGHETGHGSLGRRLRRVLSDGLKGLAHGVLADEIDRLIDEREQAAENADLGIRLLKTGEGVIRGLAHTLCQQQAEAGRLQAEVERLKADFDRAQYELGHAEADRDQARREREAIRAERDHARAEVERLQGKVQEALAELDDERLRVGRLQARVDTLDPQVYAAGQEIDRLRKERDAQLGAKTRARLENAELRAGLTKIANNRHAGVRVGGVGGCTDNCPTCIAVEALRLADAAGAPGDTAPTGQKVVTADGRLADVCFDGLVRLTEPDAWCGRCDTPLGRRPTQGEVNVTCSGCGAVVTLTPPHDPMGEG